MTEPEKEWWETVREHLTGLNGLDAMKVAQGVRMLCERVKFLERMHFELLGAHNDLRDEHEALERRTHG